MRSVLRDLRFGAWNLVRDRGFTVVALLTLAITIGANAAIFSVVYAVLLRPLPYPEPDRLVFLYNLYPNVGVTQRGSNAVPDYYDRRQESDVFESLALFNFESRNIGAEGSPERVRSVRTTPELFSLLGIEPVLGRTFLPEESEIGNEKVALLAYPLWRRLYAGDEAVLGSTIRISGEPHTIVGVLPEGFDLLDREAQLYMPFAFTPEQRSEDARHSNFASMLARLAPGVSVAAAQARIDALNDRISQDLEYRELLENAGFYTRVEGLAQAMVADVEPTLYLLQGGVLFVLLIGCVNVANLMLIRANRRMKELAIRFALGAGRLRVARQLLTESVLLALAGGALGLLVAAVGVEALSAFGVDQLPRGHDVRLDPAVLLFTLSVAVGTGLLFGVIPVVQVLRSDLQQIFRESGRTGSEGRSSALARAALVVFQLATAVVLLAGAGLMAVSFGRVLSVDPGFTTEGILTARLTLPEARYDEPEKSAAFAREALAELRALPGVEEAGFVDNLPLGGSLSSSVITVEGYTLSPGESPPVPHWSRVDAGYFEAMEIPIVAGRGFEEGDVMDAAPVVVVDQNLARRYWPDDDPLGRRIRPGVGESEEEAEDPWFTVVGVTESVRSMDLAEADTVGSVYFHLPQRPSRDLTLVARTSLDPEGLTPSIRRKVLAVDPELPLFDVMTMNARVDESLGRRKTPMVLLAIFAGVALLLSAVGIYGVLAYAVSQRTREIGIRTALGARPRMVLEMVLWQGVKLVLLGLGIGLVAAAFLTQLLKGLLYDIEPADPAVLLGVSLLLAVIALAACLVPSLRAARVDPVVALRDE